MRGWLVSSLLVVLAATVAWAQGPTASDAASRRFESLASQAGQRAPLMRIGLEGAHRIEIRAGRPYRILDPLTGETVWKPRFDGTIQAVAEGGPTGEVARVYRVQVAAFSTREAAREELDRVLGLVGGEGIVHHDPDRGNWRVRLGRASSRQGLSQLAETLRTKGIGEFWIAEEPAETLSGVRLRLVDESFESFPTAVERLAIVPAAGDHIRVDGKPYRGVIELRIDAVGQIRPIDWVGLEVYLLGVVPAELGPEVWPEIEALKAQAVAARTYAWRNRGQFSGAGYDICGTPRCQVYSGVDAEHPLSDRAVLATAGQMLSWEGEAIIALYTATCGGHTDHGKDVFADHDEPYLTGVPCRAENDALASLRATIQGRAIPPLFDETGADVTRDWSLLRASTVLPDEAPSPGALLEPITAEVQREWTAAMARQAGLAAPAGPPPPVEDLGQAAAGLVADLGWDDRARHLISEQDVPALLRDTDAANLPPSQNRALAYLAWVEGLRPAGDGSFHVMRSPSRARLIPALSRIGESYEAFGLRQGVVSGVGKKSIRLVQGKGEIRLALADRPYLFSLVGGKAVPAEHLELWPGDRVRFRRNPSGEIDFLELAPPVKGASDDRSAAVYSWEVRKSRRRLEATINRRVRVGRLQDLRIVERGISGRATVLRVVGSSGESTVRGFDIRGLLGDLRERPTVIEIQRDAAGAIVAVVFAGKGWGHGVGMCQVGAYGMALRGADYREILGHYYQGATLAPLK